MFTKCFSYIKRQWRQVSGALAVLLMFMVPATRAVLAGNSNWGDQNNYNQNDSQRNQCSQPAVSTPRPVSPVQPGSHSGSGEQKPGEK
jgi:hypothetical protein